MKLSQATGNDFDGLVQKCEELDRSLCADEIAQAFIDVVYDKFNESIVLLRVFSSFPLSQLNRRDQDLVNEKVAGANMSSSVGPSTPVLTLLGSRGKESKWNQRKTSESFRCIPLISSNQVSGLTMLNKQFDAMSLNLDVFNSWENDVVKTGRADYWTGSLHIQDASVDKDGQGRMIVPKQDFVSSYGVKTVVGCGGGYSCHPTLVTVFAFSNEQFDESVSTCFMGLLKSYMLVTETAIVKGCFFSS